ncbi:SpoIIE family protein phosphatase [Streptomyces sp. NPDC127074]|uniref:SpoIIE family protein phosphatase n=1 Tax=Streptomyces sp. NPDC127074 TaxID=3347130 RepID=UPI0036545132
MESRVFGQSRRSAPDGGVHLVPPEATVPSEFEGAAAVALDADGTITGWSVEAERLLGYSAGEMVGRSVTALLADSAAAPVGLPTPENWTGVVTVCRADDEQVQLGVRLWTVQRPGGTGPGAIAVGYDLSEVPWWEANRPLLERLLARSPIGMGVLDTELRYVWANDELERLGGVPLAERLGRTPHEVQPMLDPDSAEAVMRRVLETGEPVLDFEFAGRVRKAPHQHHAAAASVFRIQDAADRVLGICFMVIDATDRWRSRERLALLSEAGERVGNTLDILHTAQELADVAVPRLADFVTVDLFEPVIQGQEPTPQSPRRARTLRRAAQQSVRPSVPESVARIGQETSYAPGSPVGRCLEDGKAHLEATLAPADSPWIPDDPERAAKVAEFGLHSYMSVPIRARQTTLGVVGFLRWQRSDPFEEEDLELAKEVVARGALCIDNARRYTREHTGALALQRSLLPRETSGSAELDVATRYLPAGSKEGVGGDWFDVIPLSGARIGLVVGDVVGHGVNAAATMGRLRTAVRALADMDLPPDELLAHLDDLVTRFIDEDSSGDRSASNALLGSSCLVMNLDPVAQRCTMARAGHPPPALVGPDGTVRFMEMPAGPPLGLGYLPFETTEIDVPHGSLLVLYTDGLVAGPEQDMEAGQHKLSGILGRGGDDPEAVCDDVVAELVPAKPRDDIALMVARARAVPQDRVAVIELDSDPAVVASTRAEVDRQLADWGLDDLAFSTELIVSELVTNAIRYATGPLRLRLIRQSVLICEVVDGSSTSPHLRHARTTDEGGRGLFLVAQLSKRWGTRYLPTGKIIWSEQELAAA